jgi:hypothetical protein
MKVTECQLVKALVDVLDTCDADELARLASELLGGKCIWDAETNFKDLLAVDVYDFEPNENYADAFGFEMSPASELTK